MTQMNLSMKQKQTHRDREQTCVYLGERRSEKDSQEFGVSRSKLLHMRWINNKVLLYSPGTCIQYPVINHHGREYEKEGMYN